MKTLVSDLLFPTIYTVIGAVIGGWFAYLIAKRNFMLDRLHQGDECVELLKFSADNLNTQCDALHNHVRTYTDCQEEDECIAFLRNLSDKGGTGENSYFFVFVLLGALLRYNFAMHNKECL